jgi:hypothetical protein
MATNNAINLKTAGIVVYDAAGTFTADTTTTNYVLVGAASNGITNVAPSAATGIPLVSNGAGVDPSFTNAVVAGGGTGAVTFTAYSVICAGTTATGAFQNVSGVGTAAQVLTSNGAAALPTWQAATGGGGLTWTVITADQSGVAGNGYICNKAGTLTITLPASGAIGDIIEITGINTATGWAIAQNANQQIFLGTSSTTVGAGGSITSINIRDWIKILCVVAGASTVWNATALEGNFTIV